MLKKGVISAVCLSGLLLASCGNKKESEAIASPGPLPKAAAYSAKSASPEIGGRSVQAWYAVAMNKNEDKLEREQAIRELSGAGRPGLALLFELLRAPDTKTVETNAAWGRLVPPGFVRWQAAIAFGDLGSDGLPAAPMLITLMLNDSVVDVRGAAAMALVKLCAHDAATVEAFKDVIRRSVYYLWPAAAAVLGRIQLRDQEAEGMLTDLAHADPWRAGNDQGLWAVLINARTEARAALNRSGSPCSQ
jgi:HEAT repeat protein